MEVYLILWCARVVRCCKTFDMSCENIAFMMTTNEECWNERSELMDVEFEDWACPADGIELPEIDVSDVIFEEIVDQVDMDTFLDDVFQFPGAIQVDWDICEWCDDVLPVRIDDLGIDMSDVELDRPLRLPVDLEDIVQELDQLSTHDD